MGEKKKVPTPSCPSDRGACGERQRVSGRGRGQRASAWDGGPLSDGHDECVWGSPWVNEAWVPHTPADNRWGDSYPQ